MKKKQGKASGMALNFRNPEVRYKFEQKLKGDDVGTLKAQLHYSGLQIMTSAAKRLETRTALCLAFAHGASPDRIQKLRGFLDKTASAEVRSNVLQELNRSSLKVDDFIDTLCTSGAFNPASYFTENQIQRLRAGNHGFCVAPDSTDARFAVNFVNKHREELGLAENPGDAQDGRHVPIFTAVTIYCGYGYKVINQQLRDGGLKEDNGFVVQAARYALDLLPDWHGVTMRGADLPDEVIGRYQVGQTVTEAAFTSTSANKGFDDNVQFIIGSKRGKNVSELSPNVEADGIEILFPPGTSFKVLEKSKMDNVTYIVMQEAD